MAISKGVKTEMDTKVGVYVSEIHDGDYTKLQSVDFGFNKLAAKEVEFRAASGLRGGTIELHLDAVDGPLMAIVAVTGTGGWCTWRTFKGKVTAPAEGVLDLYIVYKGRKGPKLFNLDWWRLRK